MRIIFCLLAILTFHPVSYSQSNIDYVEYFVDVDPGLGKGKPITITPLVNLQNVQVSLDTAGLSEGIHYLTVRARNAAGSWGLAQTYPFYRPFKSSGSSVAPLPNIVYAEYYLDTDPGLGSATNLNITPSTNVANIAISLDTALMTTGIHHLIVRGRDNNGAWSLNHAFSFIKPFKYSDSLLPVTNVTYAEYFIDNDPGFGKAVPIPFTPGTDVSNLLISFDTAGITPGIHKVFVRAKDGRNNWSLSQNWLFLKPFPSVTETQPVGKITYAEYFFGTDPGFGNGTSFSITPSENLNNLLIQVDTANLKPGINSVTVRARNEFGKWSLNNIYFFYKVSGTTEPPKPALKITYLEYFVDSDPGLGKGTVLDINPSIDISNITIPLNIVGWEVGNYNLFVRGRDSAGNWSLVNKWSFKIETPAGYTITVGDIVDTACTSSIINIPYTVNSPFGTTNVFTAQLSQSNGTFLPPINIGSISSRTSDTIRATLPQFLPIGNSYRIRVIASTPYDTSEANNEVLAVRSLPRSFILYGDTLVCKVSRSYYGSPQESLANVRYVWKLEDGGTLTPNNGSATVNWSQAGTYPLSLTAINYCGSYADTLMIHVIDNTLTGPFSNMLPSDSNRNLTYPINLSWFPINDAVSYDLYIWPSNQSRPLTPYVSNITSINYVIHGGLQYEQFYRWQLVAKRACYTLESPVQVFQLRYLPDLIVNSIQVPSSAFSGQPLTVSWEIKNNGLGSTLQQQWYDLVYLSHDAVLDNNDVLLGSVSNQSALQPGKSYLQTSTFNLPKGINDNYYVIVHTNPYYYQLTENNKDNNISSSGSQVFVQLTPPPDLQVTSVIAPNFAFSNQNMEVSYTITNRGNGGTVASQWYDRIYFSKDSVFNAGNAVIAGSFYHNGALGKNDSYSQKQSLHIPETFLGKYFVYVTADINNNVYEHASENNNTGRSDSMNVLLTPPIDLTVTSIEVPGSVSNRQTATIKWRVENAGGSSTSGKYWLDAVYISKSSVFRKDSAQYLGGVYRFANVESGEGYDAEVSVTIPAKFNGNYYFYVRTDADSIVFEHTYEGNNVLRSSPVAVLSPDLIVSSLVIPATDSSGEFADIQFGIKNNGPGVLYPATITNKVYYSTSPDYNPSSVTELYAESVSTGTLATGDSLSRKIQAKLPNGLSGNFYLYVVTDYANNVYEGVKEDNNTKRSNETINVILSPWPDLQVTDISIPDSAVVSGIVNLSYKVINQGNRRVSDTLWSDNIYISKMSTWSPESSILMRDVIINRTLGRDSAYFVSTTFKVPGTVAEGNYYVYIFTDAKNQVYENVDEANNISRKGFLNVRKYPPVDLSVTSVIAPASGNSGQPVSIVYSVENIGSVVTLFNQWNDALYLSTDTGWNKNEDILVKTIVHKGSVEAGSGYTTTENVVLPNGLSGNYYLIMVADADDVNNDPNRRNNFRLISAGNDSLKITITLTPPPDLTVTNLKVPDQGTAGQPITISWKVKNSGVGSTGEKAWVEKMYLSSNVTLDNSDILLGTFIRNDALAAGQEYMDTLRMYLPNSVLGNYVVIFKTDGNDNIYEHLGENNNTLSSLITIAKPPLSDIVVSDILVPASEIMAGDPAKIEWKVKNIGANPAIGYMKQGVYLSTDTIRDVSDILLNSQESYINLAPQAEVSDSVIKEIKGVSLRDYNVIIHTDILNNILETDDNNNIAYSHDKLKVNVPELKLNITATRTLLDNKEVYYRIEVPDSLTGESLLVTLKGDSVNGSNEMYLRFGDVPTRVLYDYSYSLPYSANQEVVVPELQKGTYYIMVYGSTTSGNVQQISLLARKLNFEIRTVNANVGGNTGQVTVMVNGSKFQNVQRVTLNQDQLQIIADSFKIIDPTKMFVTFNLAGANLGWFDVTAENVNQQTAVLVNGFRVEKGGNANLQTSIIAPPNTRPSNVITISVQFTNAGNTDIINPSILFKSLGGAPVGFSLDDLKKNITELRLDLSEVNGPKGILRPGGSGTITIYARATSALMFSVVKP